MKKRILAVKKERADREKESGLMKERIDNERKEIQISVDKVIVRRLFYADESNNTNIKRYSFHNTI